MKYLHELREESKGNTRLLWHHDYWDGPISGVMLWNGEANWFQQIGDDVITWVPFTDEEKNDWKVWCKEQNYKFDEEDCVHCEGYRAYNVYKTPLEIMEAITYNHEQFRKYVGDHTDYDMEGHRPHGQLKPYSEHEKFYKGRDSHKTYDLKLKDLEIIGTFMV